MPAACLSPCPPLLARIHPEVLSRYYGCGLVVPPLLEDACEDHGQAVIYRGSIAEHPNALPFDKHLWIETGKVFPVCGNTFRLLAEGRLAPHFEFIGDFSRHYGLFEG